MGDMMRFPDLARQYSHVARATARMFPEECSLAEAALAFSFDRYFSLDKNGMDDLRQELAALFYRNCIYLSATYSLLRSGMPDPAGNNMRTVFETLIWQYAYLADRNIFSTHAEISSLEQAKFSGKWSGTKERKLQNLRRKYSFQKTMKSLYSKERFESFFFNQYWVLSQKSHTSTFGINFNTPNMEGKTTIEKNPDELAKNLRAVLYLCSENLICFLNCFESRLSEKEKASCMDFVNRINKSIPPVPGIAPDTMELEFRVQFKEVN
jgi:hypothetical protein